MAAFRSNIDITSGGTYGMNITNGESSAKVAADLNGKFNNIQTLLQNQLPEVWTGSSLPDSLVSGKLLEFASNLYFGNNSNVTTQLANLASVNTVSSNLSTHTNNRSNPHSVTAAQVGALSTTGGKINGNLSMTGNLTLKNSGNFGNQINFGDSDYVHFLENADDCLEIKAKKVNFVIADSSDTKFTINNTNPFSSSRSLDISGFLWTPNSDLNLGFQPIFVYMMPFANIPTSVKYMWWLAATPQCVVGYQVPVAGEGVTIYQDIGGYFTSNGISRKIFIGGSSKSYDYAGIAIGNF